MSEADLRLEQFDVDGAVAEAVEGVWGDSRADFLRKASEAKTAPHSGGADSDGEAYVFCNRTGP